MRGKDFSDFFKVRMTGITPAYAGKSFSISVYFLFSRDHPRVCGEKACMSLKPGLGEGSPPRMRGKVVQRRAKLESNVDHPRVCGEKHLRNLVEVSLIGSPPRMRGKAIFCQ